MRGPGQSLGPPRFRPRGPPTSFSAAVSSMNLEPWPGFPVLVTRTPGRGREGAPSARERLVDQACPSSQLLSRTVPQNAPRRAAFCPQMEKKRGREAQALAPGPLRPPPLWPSLPSAQGPPSQPHSHQGLRSL